MIRIATLLAPVAIAGLFASAPAIHADPMQTQPTSARTAQPQAAQPGAGQDGLASQTMAEMNTCGTRNDIVKQLSDQFKEQPQAVGMVDKSAVLEIFVSDAGTWTILATGTDGNSCILSAGEGWQDRFAALGPNA